MGENLVLYRNSWYYNTNYKWAITRMPGNPITGRGGPISEMAIAVEIFQVAYVIITAIILVKERRKWKINPEEKTDKENRLIILLSCIKLLQWEGQ